MIILFRLSKLGVPMKLINGVRSFYDNYVARLRIGTKLTALYFVTTGTYTLSLPIFTLVLLFVWPNITLRYIGRAARGFRTFPVPILPGVQSGLVPLPPSALPVAPLVRP
jgi:hypothetical protein